MFKIAICDDCAADSSRLTECIRRNLDSEMEVQIYEYTSGEALLQAMEDILFAVIFLDIQMKGIDGNQTAKRIRKIDANLVLVFYTGFVEPSPVSFEVQPYRYIMKSMNERMIDNYVRDVLQKMQSNRNIPPLRINIGKKQLFVSAEHVIYIEKYKKSTRVHIAVQALQLYGIEAEQDGGYPDLRMQEKLTDTYVLLQKYGFGLPHDSYIINFQYLRSCTAKTLCLAEIRGEFQISRSKAKEFHELKNKFICSKYVGRRA